MNGNDTNLKSSSLYETMRSGIFTNPDGRILIIYDRTILDPIEWVEYDKDNRKLYIIHHEGVPQALGIAVDSEMNKNLLMAKEVAFKCIQNNKIVHTQIVPLVLQEC